MSGKSKTPDSATDVGTDYNSRFCWICYIGPTFKHRFVLSSVAYTFENISLTHNYALKDRITMNWWLFHIGLEIPTLCTSQNYKEVINVSQINNLINVQN